MRGARRAFEPASFLSTRFSIPTDIHVTTYPQNAQDRRRATLHAALGAPHAERVADIGGIRLLNICY